MPRICLARRVMERCVRKMRYIARRYDEYYGACRVRKVRCVARRYDEYYGACRVRKMRYIARRYAAHDGASHTIPACACGQASPRRCSSAAHFDGVRARPVTNLLLVKNAVDMARNYFKYGFRNLQKYTII